MKGETRPLPAGGDTNESMEAVAGIVHLSEIGTLFFAGGAPHNILSVWP